MNLRRTIAALGAAFALSFGLMLAPSQAEAATVTINPRANAVEAGQVLAAPDGSVFTITVYDAGLAAGQKSVTHTFQTGDTLRQTANKIVQAINADTEFQAIGVTATLQNDANYTISSTSTNGTLYKQTTTGGGSNRMAIQQTLTIGGTVTVDDKLTLTIYDAGLVGGKEAVVYKPNTGDTLADIVIKLRNKINNSTTLAALGITAKVSSTDSSVLLIESPTFDATEKFTSYLAKVKAGGTETMALGSFWGTNGAQSITVTGPVVVDETVQFTVFNDDLPDSQKTVSYVTQAGDTLNKIRCGLRTEVNNDPDLAEIGVHATCAGGVLDLTSTSSNPTAFWQDSLVNCQIVDPLSIHWPPNSRVKFCGSAGQANGQIVRSTLEALGNTTVLPGGAGVLDASTKLSGNFNRTWFIFGNHDEYYKSQHIPFFRKTDGPSIIEGQAVHDPVDPDLSKISKILGYTYGHGNGTYSVIFVSSKDVKHGVPTGIPNDTIAHATAHETGHHIDQWSGGSLSSSSEMATAWNTDLALMAPQPPCRWDAPIANTDPQQYVTRDGVFSGAVDYKGNYICTGGPDGSGNNSIYGGNSVDVLYQAYPYFGQPNLPLSEVFPEVFANLSGFWDTMSNSGGNIDGSSRVDTSMALQCTRIYVWAWSNFGRNPTISEIQTGVYSQPLGTKTRYTNCDGTVTDDDNSGS